MYFFDKKKMTNKTLVGQQMIVIKFGFEK